MEVKKRGWVKNAAIIFLVVMVVLTFFSNTIMNRTLPEVAAQYSASGTITARIRGTGTVTANEVFEVVTNQTRTVSEVPVRRGDEVLAGDVLIAFMGDESEELERAQSELHEAELALERMLINTSLDGNFASENREIQKARNDLTAAQRTLAGIAYSDAAVAAAQSAFNQAQSAADLAKQVLDARQLDEDIARAILHSIDEFQNPDEYSLAQQKLTDAVIANLNAQAEYNVAAGIAASRLSELDAVQGLRADWTAANENVRQLQQNLEDMIFALSESQRAEGVQTSLTAIDLRELRNTIEEKREEVADLQAEGSRSEVTALVSGIVTEINVTPGNQAQPDTPLMKIEVTDRGYSLSFSVPVDQAARVSVGDNADVDRGFWGMSGDLRATLTGIRNDPQSPTTNRMLHFSISGEIESGTQLSLTLAQRSENYGVIVPNSAVRTDTNGDFVLVVMSRSGPLGNRYIATRVDVNVLASDDVSTAVSGGLGSWEFVITRSTQPIEPGMQVRLVDNP